MEVISMFARRRASRAAGAPSHAVERPSSLGFAPERSAVVDELCTWAGSLPWVVQEPLPAGEGAVQRFTVDCPPLGCRRTWLTLQQSEALACALELFVVLPWRVARRGIAVGWAALVGELGDDLLIVGVAVPSTSTELLPLEALLGVAYGSAFASPEDRRR
jgi:hypothetical protein